MRVGDVKDLRYGEMRNTFVDVCTTFDLYINLEIVVVYEHFLPFTY